MEACMEHVGRLQGSGYWTENFGSLNSHNSLEHRPFFSVTSSSCRLNLRPIEPETLFGNIWEWKAGKSTWTGALSSKPQSQQPARPSLTIMSNQTCNTLQGDITGKLPRNQQPSRVQLTLINDHQYRHKKWTSNSRPHDFSQHNLHHRTRLRHPHLHSKYFPNFTPRIKLHTTLRTKIVITFLPLPFIFHFPS